MIYILAKGGLVLVANEVRGITKDTELTKRILGQEREDKKMKNRVFCLLCLFLVVFITVPAFAEDTFSLHCGVEFGMDYRDVLNLEASEGFQLEMYQNWKEAPIGAAGVTKDTLLHTRGEFAGGMFSDLNYIINSQGYLVASAYSVSQPDYPIEDIATVLKEKYGDPDIVNDDYIDIGDNWDAIDNQNNYADVFSDVTLCYINQWIYPVADGYVDIMLVEYTYDFIGSDMPNYIVSYTFRTPEEYNSLVALQEIDTTHGTANNDL